MEEDIALENSLPKYGAPSSGELTPLDGTTPTASGVVTPLPQSDSSHPMAAEAEFDSLHRELRRVWGGKGKGASKEEGVKKEDSQKT
jgi:hypothetical protein